jgi:hypothetical protein
MSLLAGAPSADLHRHAARLEVVIMAPSALQAYRSRGSLTFLLFCPLRYSVSLPVMYGIRLLVIALLYRLAAGVAEVKARSPAWWLSNVISSSCWLCGIESRRIGR